MPNWCYNSGDITCDSHETAEQIIKHTNEGTLLNWIAPEPEELKPVISGSCYAVTSGRYTDEISKEVEKAHNEAEVKNYPVTIKEIAKKHGVIVESVNYWVDNKLAKKLGFPTFPTPFQSETGDKDRDWVTIIPPATLSIWKQKYGAVCLYDWHVENWGTKWDIMDGHARKYDHTTDHVIELSFSTAWSPPTKAYETLWGGESVEEMLMDYSEPGAGYQGEWRNGEDFTTDYVEEEEEI